MVNVCSTSHINYFIMISTHLNTSGLSMSSNFNGTNLKHVVDRFSSNTSTVKYVLVSSGSVESRIAAPVAAQVCFMMLTLFCLPARISSPASNHPLSLSTQMNAVLFFCFGAANRAILTRKIPTSTGDD